MIIVEVPREDRIVRARKSAHPVSLDLAESGNTALRFTQIMAMAENHRHSNTDVV